MEFLYVRTLCKNDLELNPDIDQTALCSGRTLLKEDNGWLNQLMPMADSDLMAHHALLAFGAGYALEYRPTPELLELANEHYREASALLSDRLSRPIPTGGEDVLVGTFRLMWADDVSTSLASMSHSVKLISHHADCSVGATQTQTRITTLVRSSASS